MLLAQEVLLSRVVSMLLTGTAIGAIPGEGALPAVESIQTTTRATERVSRATEVVTKVAAMG